MKRKKVNRIILVILLTVLVSFGLAERKPIDGVPVLLYHQLMSNREYETIEKNDAIMSIGEFKKQMEMIAEAGYQTITLDQLQQHLSGEVTAPENSIVITFDDGYMSDYRLAYPVLKEYGFHAESFLVTSFLQEDSGDEERLFTANTEETKDVFTFHSHSHALHTFAYEHGDLSELLTENLTWDTDLSLQTLEIKGIKEKEDLDAFSYPYGKYDDRFQEILTFLDVSLGFTTRKGYVKEGCDPLALPRFGVYPERFGQLYRILH
jgi:peptidoglycan/xylan/chitin deacetylase (PgdA/CDA1 family)